MPAPRPEVADLLEVDIPPGGISTLSRSAISGRGAGMGGAASFHPVHTGFLPPAPSNDAPGSERLARSGPVPVRLEKN